MSIRYSERFFMLSGDRLMYHDVIHNPIPDGALPIGMGSHHTNLSLADKIQAIPDGCLADGYIRRSTSPWARFRQQGGQRNRNDG